MGENIAVIFYIAVPVVILASVFVYYFYERREDVEDVSQRQVPPSDEPDTREAR